MNDRPERRGEFDLISRYFAPLAAGYPGSFGLRDDAAVIAPDPGCELVVTADAIVAGVHFLAGDPADDVARKLLRVSLSDLAAKGARPLGYVITTAWPRDLPEDWIAGFAAGLADDQPRFGVSLLGGDTVSTDGPTCLSLTAFGQVPVGRMLRRNGARAGDRIMVSGTIGDAGAGLALLKGDAGGLEPAARDFLVDRYRRPQPRNGLGPALLEVASSCIDVSDGLLADLAHLCAESGTAGEVHGDRVPLSPARRGFGNPQAAWTAGDDYELLFTVAPDKAEAAFAVAAAQGVPVTDIGEMTAGNGVRIVDGEGRDVTPRRLGYVHF
jgi:thiamine-monophosphate kinase